MNNDILSGKWTEVKGKLKEAFGKLTDDDLLQVQGSTDRILGVLQERYGYSKAQAQQEWTAFANRQRATADASSTEVMDSVKTTIADVKDGAANLAKTLADKVESAVKKS